MRKHLQKWLPTPATIKSYRWLRPFAHLLQHHNLWHLHRRSVAGGVAVGLLCGLIPGPFQMLSAALMAVWLRVNLPVALFTTLYTNPFTILPLYVVAYELGAGVTGMSRAASLSVPDLGFSLQQWWQWIVSLGQPFFIGLPLLAVLLAVVGYCFVRVVWRVMVVVKWRTRHRRKS